MVQLERRDKMTNTSKENKNDSFTSPSIRNSTKRIRGNGTTPNYCFREQSASNSQGKKQPGKHKLSVKKRLALSPISQNDINHVINAQCNLRDKNEDVERLKNFSFESVNSNHSIMNKNDSYEAVTNNRTYVTTRRRNNNNVEDKFISDERSKTSLQIGQGEGLLLDSSQISRVPQSIESDMNNIVSIESYTSLSENSTISRLSSEKIEFDLKYPTCVKQPDQKTLRYCYNQSMINLDLDQVVEQDLVHKDFSKFSHQQLLKLYGCSLLSLEDVIIPSIIKSHNYELKKMQSKSQRVKDSPVTDLIKLCRVEIQSSAIKAVQALKCCRIEMNYFDERNLLLAKKEERKQRKKLRAERKKMKELRLQEKMNLKKQRKEDKFRQMKKSWPKNKELWSEVAKLMTNLGVMKKEEKIWKEFLQKFNFDQHSFLPRIDLSDPLQTLDKKQLEPIDISTGEPIHNTIDDMSLAANRINDALSLVSTLLERSDSVRHEVYDKYENDHKFHGYRSVKNPKTLIRALAFCD